MKDLNFIFKMPEEKELARTIVVKGEKGDPGDISDVRINGVSVVKNGVANIEGMITKAVNDLENYYLKEEVNNMVSAIPKFAIEVVSELPNENISNTTIYLLISEGENLNLYDEYIYVNSNWEKLGTQTVDLTNYYNKTETDEKINDIESNINEIQVDLENHYNKTETDEKINDIEDKAIIDKTKITGKTSQEGTPSPDNIVPIKNVNVSNVDENGYGTLTLNLQKDTDTKTVTLISKRLHEDDSVDENGFHYNNGTLVLDGTETFLLHSNTTNNVYTYYMQISDMVKSTEQEVITTHFNFKSNCWNITDKSEGQFAINNGSIYLNSSLTTVDEFKAWLVEQYVNGIPVTIEYGLAKQENEPFDGTNQNAWNTLEDLLINGYTFINSSSDELQPTITLTEHTANEIHRENVAKLKELEKKIALLESLVSQTNTITE